MSGKTYEKAKAVDKAAKQDPELYGDLPGMMDAVSVDAASLSPPPPRGGRLPALHRRRGRGAGLGPLLQRRGASRDWNRKLQAFFEYRRLAEAGR
jgi:hypothetical protein